MGIPKIKFHPIQSEYFHCSKRYSVVAAGRRSGKTMLSKLKILKANAAYDGDDEPRFFCAAPTRDQAKRIYWDDLKDYSRDLFGKDFLVDRSESQLILRYKNGGEIHVIGLDKPERVEGSPWDGCIIDEYANVKETAWTENILPALADRRGFANFIGVPEGRNHFYKLYKSALEDTTGDWGAFTWKSEDILPEDIVRSAKRDMDELTFLQEFCASFVTFEGNAYYAFDDNIHCERNLSYDPYLDLIFCFDFNISPGVAVVCQEDPNYDLTKVIGEVYIKRGSNTELVCDQLVEEWGDHQGRVLCYGDYTGGSLGSAKLMGSDWDICERVLGDQFGKRLDFMLRPNPKERERLNAVNSRLMSFDKTVRMVLDPEKAPNLIWDFENTLFAKDGSGEIDKKGDKWTSHMCFGKGTKVDTDRGIVNIEELPKKGFIKTFDDTYSSFVNPGSRGFKETVKLILNTGKEIVATKDHLFLTTKGWKKAVDLTSDTMLYSTQLNNFLREDTICQRKKKILSLFRKFAKNFWGKNINFIKEANIFLEIIVKIAQKIGFIRLFGNIIMDLYQKVMLFIISMKIVPIITLVICEYTKNQFIKLYTCVMQEEKKLLDKLSKNMLNQKRLNGMDLKKEKRGIKNMPNNKLGKENLQKFVITVEKNTKLPCVKKVRDIVRESAKPLNLDLSKGKQCRKELAEFVEKHSEKIHHTFIKKKFRNFVPKSVMVKVEQVIDNGVEEVFCPIVEKGCFILFDNIIVSNSDSLGYYCWYEFPVGSGAKYTISRVGGF